MWGNKLRKREKLLKVGKHRILVKFDKNEQVYDVIDVKTSQRIAALFNRIKGWPRVYSQIAQEYEALLAQVQE